MLKRFNFRLLGTLTALTFGTACTSAQPGAVSPPGAVRVLLDREPVTLNPRRALDAGGQRLGALIYRGLSRIDARLQPRPDLASGWKVRQSGRRWDFEIRPDLRDHQGLPITAEAIARCLENYRTGEPLSALAAAFPNWKKTTAKGNRVSVLLSEPDPYLARNFSLLRYFRQEGSPPCAEPVDTRPVIASGPYRVNSNDGLLHDLTPQHELILTPVDRSRENSPLHFLFVREEATRALMMLRGDAHAAPNSFSLSKTAWFKTREDFRVLERDGVNVTYMAFNLRDPLTSNPAVRHAIARSIDRELITRKRQSGLTTPAWSFLSPLLPEAAPLRTLRPLLQFDPKGAEQLLDEAGFPRGEDGVRFTLNYKTTTNPIGIERGLMIQDMLRRIGIELSVNIVEPAVFFSSLREGNFQLYCSRWVGVADGSIYRISMRSGQPRNRVHYSSPEVDRAIDAAHSEPDAGRRKKLLNRVQAAMLKDLPYAPLWYWNNALVLQEGVGGLKPEELSISGGLDPLARLRLED